MSSTDASVTHPLSTVNVMTSDLDSNGITILMSSLVTGSKIVFTSFFTTASAIFSGITSPNISTNNWLSSGCPSLYGRYIIGRESPYTANENAELAADGACWAIAVRGEKAGSSAKVESRTRRLIPKRVEISFMIPSLRCAMIRLTTHASAKGAGEP